MPYCIMLHMSIVSNIRDNSTYLNLFIHYSNSSALDIVIALIVDDGVPTRGHRNNLFDSCKDHGAEPLCKYLLLCALISITFVFFPSGLMNGAICCIVLKL